MSTQIKCPSCGGVLNLDDAACPFCGHVNDVTAAHAKARQTLEEKVRKAEEESKSARSGWRVPILLGVVLLCLLAGIFYTNNYEDSFYSRDSARREADALANADSYLSQIDAFLAQEDYIRVHALRDSINVPLARPPYEPYYMVFRLSGYYAWITEELMVIPFGSHAVLEDYGEVNRPDFERLGYLFSGFHESMDPAYYQSRSYDVDEELGLHHAKIMEEEIRAMLCTWLHATDEQISAWRTYPAARIEREMEALYDKESP